MDNFIGPLTCIICGYSTSCANPNDLGITRGNTAQYLNTKFHLWRCSQCHSIHNIDPVDYEEIYRLYPLKNRKLDIYARGTLRNLLNRLIGVGLKKTDTILDYGCGNNVFIQFLNELGYNSVTGFDPYLPEFSNRVTGKLFDCVICNDVIEHVDNPRLTLMECAKLVTPGGILYVGTADSQGVVDMHDLEKHLMRLHQPYHRTIITRQMLLQLGAEMGMDLTRSYKRSYMDTLFPFANYRFLDEFNKALGHNMDLAFSPRAGRIILKNPILLFYAFLGYFFPSADEPAIILRK